MNAQAFSKQHKVRECINYNLLFQGLQIDFAHISFFYNLDEPNAAILLIGSA
ncbi:MAG: hypothetical protein JWM04_432 [Verrucomicrobiales bacterium]|nr:hypothetical protein [Verrucomicrobiales bacterium]